MNAAYRLGVLLLLFGGFLALNSTGVISGVGVASLLIGLLVGVIGILQSGLSDADRSDRAE